MREARRDISELCNRAFEVTVDNLFCQSQNIPIWTKPDFFVETLKHIDNEIEFSTSGGRKDVSDLLHMMVSLLEQQIPMSRGHDMSELQTQVIQFHEPCFDYKQVEDYIEELFYGFAERALYEWEKIEVEAMLTSQSWVQPVYESNRDEEASLVICMKGSNLGEDSMNIHRFEGEGCEELRRAVKKLQGIINEEENVVEILHVEVAYWSSMLDLAKISSYALIDFTLLDKLLPFEAESLLADNVGISFPHLDGPGSKTIFTWNNNNQDQNLAFSIDHGGNDSMSVFSSDSSMMGAMITGIPVVKRLSSLRNQDETHELYCQETHLLNGSVANDIYSLLLSGDHMDALIPHRFELEHELGILTMSDVFERLVLLAKDIVALQSYHHCYIERGLHQHSVVIRVTIPYGQSSSISIRFTYDLSNERCIIYCIPTEASISPVIPTDAAATNKLQKVVNKELSIEPNSNAFLLKRICSSLVETLQDCNLWSEKQITTNG